MDMRARLFKEKQGRERSRPRGREAPQLELQGPEVRASELGRRLAAFQARDHAAAVDVDMGARALGGKVEALRASAAEARNLAAQAEGAARGAHGGAPGFNTARQVCQDEDIQFRDPVFVEDVCTTISDGDEPSEYNYGNANGSERVTLQTYVDNISEADKGQEFTNEAVDFGVWMATTYDGDGAVRFDGVDARSGGARRREWLAAAGAAGVAGPTPARASEISVFGANLDLSFLDPKAPEDYNKPPADAEVFPSGLVSKILLRPQCALSKFTPPEKLAKCPKAKPYDKVLIDYSGWKQADGRMFDSSRNEKKSVRVNSVMPGRRV
ncbi:unnamed protein product [Prorocentrum cordatum]|uniref:Uncharacterized protein n=1 Tax=Prorocentrum cordatum TaxID=2364126 RepID=A0ABN9S1K2_9DINO|nr:unnamed protein product [Polarella glacialis]